MIITVDHSTSYRYAYAVDLQPHTFRLRPRMTTTQRLLFFDLEVLPAPTGATECLDQDGNLALHAWFGAPVAELSVTSRFRVELLRANPFDFNLSAESEHLPLRYSYPLCASLSCYSNALNVDESVKRFATVIAANAGRNVAAFLAALNQQIFNSFRHVTRAEGPAWPSCQTLNELAGSCRDLAVLFSDVCRVVGIASRFVSGYECASVGQPDADLHAWAEVYLPSAGWRGYDPSRGLLVADRHVAVAAAFHADLASPITGAFSGICGSRMETRLHMQADCP
jgi:transglutaminase-like putative cysteine protease